MEQPIEKRRYSVAEYLEFESKSQTRHEFHDGEILAMSGGSYAQSKIKTNLIGELGNRLRGHRCEPLDSDMRVKAASNRAYVYSDALILCGKPEFDPDDRKQTTIVNPSVVFEVLSESTEAYDRGEKFSLYRQIASLQEYILISQDKPRVEIFLREDEGSWQFTHVSDRIGVANVRSVMIELPLAEIYRGVEFGAPS